IDLVGYRRYGHNEGDEPSFTQPLMYRRIAAHPPVRQLWARTLASRGRIEAGVADEKFAERMDELQQLLEQLNPERALDDPPPIPVDPHHAATVTTAAPLDTLAAMNVALLEVPEGFAVHRKLERPRERRRHAFDDAQERTITWAI